LRLCNSCTHRSLASTKQLLLQATASHDEIIIIDRQESDRSNARNNKISINVINLIINYTNSTAQSFLAGRQAEKEKRREL
jgi:hypothetical protein